MMRTHACPWARLVQRAPVVALVLLGVALEAREQLVEAGRGHERAVDGDVGLAHGREAVVEALVQVPAIRIDRYCLSYRICNFGCIRLSGRMLGINYSGALQGDRHEIQYKEGMHGWACRRQSW